MLDGIFEGIQFRKLMCDCQKIRNLEKHESSMENYDKKFSYEADLVPYKDIVEMLKKFNEVLSCQNFQLFGFCEAVELAIHKSATPQLIYDKTQHRF